MASSAGTLEFSSIALPSTRYSTTMGHLFFFLLCGTFMTQDPPTPCHPRGPESDILEAACPRMAKMHVLLERLSDDDIALPV